MRRPAVLAVPAAVLTGALCLGALVGVEWMVLVGKVAGTLAVLAATVVVLVLAAKVVAEEYDSDHPGEPWFAALAVFLVTTLYVFLGGGLVLLMWDLLPAG